MRGWRLKIEDWCRRCEDDLEEPFKGKSIKRSPAKSRR